MRVYELARINYLACAVGSPDPVPQRDILDYQERWRKGSRRGKPSAQSTREPSFWRYNKELLGE